MYCRFCGKQIPDQAKFCPECGADLAPAPSAAPPESTPSFPAAPAAPVEPAMPPQGTPDPAAAFGVIAAPRRGMKWFKFIIYFQLWAGMLVNLVTAGKYFTGAYYEGNAEMVYRVFPALQPLDIVMGVVCLALAVYAVVVQRALAKFRAKGPMMYYLMSSSIPRQRCSICSSEASLSASRPLPPKSPGASSVRSSCSLSIFHISTTANTFL